MPGMTRGTGTCRRLFRVPGETTKGMMAPPSNEDPEIGTNAVKRMRERRKQTPSSVVLLYVTFLGRMSNTVEWEETMQGSVALH